ncbi:hypothetical protein [Lewinella sp. W8]|uniref:hypothetical protein n=1 Tax=Lewinella sp. W8 TaxID=2528208 RepID=UPI00106895E1|nr:hypothetical protein [Lewinella sp. W8]MTB50045.1 hypothetical protein [Lewinella sp. W8]
MSNTLWNQAFTGLIRNTNQAAWGNWSLSTGIQAGAVGILDPNTGSFTAITQIPDAKIINSKAGYSWSVESSSAHRTESSVEFKGGYDDPSSGVKVNAGLKVDWSFSEEGGISSQATIVGENMVSDFTSLMQKNYAWLLQQARDANYVNGDGILQGFGMITHVKLCNGGINLGSLSKDSTFSLTGSVDGVKQMTGGGSANASIKGSYKEMNSSSSFERHNWPAGANEVPPSEVGISYQFASFNGKTIMPSWIMPLQNFTINLDNAHGGTYIVHMTATYNVPGQDKPVSQEVTAPGGQQKVISGIPLNATNLKVQCAFEAGDTFHFSWPNPIATWLTGQRTIDCGGVWPWGSKCTLRKVTTAVESNYVELPA